MNLSLFVFMCCLLGYEFSTKLKYRCIIVYHSITKVDHFCCTIIKKKKKTKTLKYYI